MFLLPFDFEKILKYLVSYLSYNLEWFSLIFMFLNAENVAECQQLLSTISVLVVILFYPHVCKFYS